MKVNHAWQSDALECGGTGVERQAFACKARRANAAAFGNRKRDTALAGAERRVGETHAPHRASGSYHKAASPLHSAAALQSRAFASALAVLALLAGTFAHAQAPETPAPAAPPAAKAEQMSIPAPASKLPSTASEPPKATFGPRGKSASKGHIWSAVLIANNVPKPKDPPAELRGLFPRLKRVFGYNQFEIAGQDEATIEDGADRKLTPSRAFWIDLKARQASIKEARGGYLLNLRLYQDEKPLVDTVALIAPESPLFFRGPMHARGQIIVVLLVGP